MSKHRDDVGKWLNQWKTAQANGFDKPSSPRHTPSQQQYETNMFGMNISKKSLKEEVVKPCDAKYWAEVYQLSKKYGAGAVDELLRQPLREEVAIDAAPIEKKLLKPELTSVDMPEVKELNDLHKLKIKLHDLLDRLNTMDAENKSTTKLESQIEALHKQIDELTVCLSDDSAE